MFEEIEECLLHHICHLITLERWPDQNHGPHGWYHVVGSRRFLKNRMNDQSGPIETSPVRQYRPQDSLTYVGLRVSTVCNIETLKSVNGHVDLTHATSCTAKVLP